MTATADTSALTHEVKALVKATECNEVALNAVVTRMRRHMLALVVSGIGVVIGLVLSTLVVFLFIGQTRIDGRQQCVNARTAAFLSAERAKVSGQIAGLAELRSAKTKAEASEGLDHFVTASQHYLDTISAVGDRCT